MENKTHTHTFDANEKMCKKKTIAWDLDYLEDKSDFALCISLIAKKMSEPRTKHDKSYEIICCCFFVRFLHYAN